MFVWGLNDKDQLGGLKGSKVNADRSFGLTMEFLHYLERTMIFVLATL